jgi:hypothetical protein
VVVIRKGGARKGSIARNRIEDWTVIRRSFEGQGACLRPHEVVNDGCCWCSDEVKESSTATAPKYTIPPHQTTSFSSEKNNPHSALSSPYPHPSSRTMHAHPRTCDAECIYPYPQSVLAPASPICISFTCFSQTLTSNLSNPQCSKSPASPPPPPSSPPHPAQTASSYAPHTPLAASRHPYPASLPFAQMYPQHYPSTL